MPNDTILTYIDLSAPCRLEINNVHIEPLWKELVTNNNTIRENGKGNFAFQVGAGVTKALSEINEKFDVLRLLANAVNLDREVKAHYVNASHPLALDQSYDNGTYIFYNDDIPSNVFEKLSEFSNYNKEETWLLENMPTEKTPTVPDLMRAGAWALFRKVWDSTFRLMSNWTNDNRSEFVRKIDIMTAFFRSLQLSLSVKDQSYFSFYNSYGKEVNKDGIWGLRMGRETFTKKSNTAFNPFRISWYVHHDIYSTEA